MRLGYLGPDGHVQRGGAAAAPRRRRRPSSSRCAHDPRHGHGRRSDGAVDRALVPIENSLEGAVDATLDALAGDARDVVIVGEIVLADPHLPDRRARRSTLGDDRRSSSRTRSRSAQCARFLRERAARAPRCAAATSTAEAVRSVAEHGGRGRRSGRARAAELYGARVLAEGVEDEPGNETRFVWLAPPGTPPDAGDGPWKTSIVFWGAGDAAAGLARALPVGVRLPRRQPHEDRVAAAARAPRPLPLPRRLRRARRDEPAVADAIDGAARALRARSACSGSYPAA